MASRSRERSTQRAYSSTFQARTAYAVLGWEYLDWITMRNSFYLQTGRYERMDDYISTPPYRDNPLEHIKFEGVAPTISGVCRQVEYDSISEYKHSNTLVYQVGWGNSALGHIRLSMPSSPYDYINSALRKNNPGNPDIDLLSFIFELKELPGLFKSFISKPKASDVPIGYTFGIKPLIADVMSILDLASSIDSRLKQLKKMTHGPVKERLSLGNESRSTSQDLGYGGFHGFSSRIEKSTRRRAWAVKTSLIERNKLTPPTLPDIRSMRRLLLTDNPIVTLWQLMPWSWLIDYFIGVQDFLAAFGGNRISGYKVQSLCVCVETETSGTIVQLGRQSGWTGGTYHPGRWRLVDQRRDVFIEPTPVIPGLTPILSSGQLSTIAQLGLALADRRTDIARR